MRETFFLNQIGVNHATSLPTRGDFSVEGYIFEVGGKDKQQKQIAEVPNSFIVADDQEIGYQNKIPLWLFGFLY